MESSPVSTVVDLSLLTSCWGANSGGALVWRGRGVQCDGHWPPRTFLRGPSRVAFRGFNMIQPGLKAPIEVYDSPVKNVINPWWLRLWCLDVEICRKKKPWDIYPLVNCYIAFENDHRFNVSFPIKKKWWIFPVRYVKLPKGKPPFSYGFPMVFLWFSHGFPIKTSIFLWFSKAGWLRSARLMCSLRLMRTSSTTPTGSSPRRPSHRWGSRWLMPLSIMALPSHL